MDYRGYRNGTGICRIDIFCIVFLRHLPDTTHCGFKGADCVTVSCDR